MTIRLNLWSEFCQFSVKPLQLFYLTILLHGSTFCVALFIMSTEHQGGFSLNGQKFTTYAAYERARAGGAQSYPEPTALQGEGGFRLPDGTKTSDPNKAIAAAPEVKTLWAHTKAPSPSVVNVVKGKKHVWMWNPDGNHRTIAGPSVATASITRSEAASPAPATAIDPSPIIRFSIMRQESSTPEPVTSQRTT